MWKKNDTLNESDNENNEMWSDSWYILKVGLPN